MAWCTRLVSLLFASFRWLSFGDINNITSLITSDDHSDLRDRIVQDAHILKGELQNAVLE